MNKLFRLVSIFAGYTLIAMAAFSIGEYPSCSNEPYGWDTVLAFISVMAIGWIFFDAIKKFFE